MRAEAEETGDRREEREKPKENEWKKGKCIRMKNESRRKLDSCYILSCLTCKYGMRHFLGSPLEGENERERERQEEKER